MAESYGGRDEPLDSLVSGLVAAGLEPLMDLRVKDEPSEALYQVRAHGAQRAPPSLLPLHARASMRPQPRLHRPHLLPAPRKS